MLCRLLYLFHQFHQRHRYRQHRRFDRSLMRQFVQGYHIQPRQQYRLVH